MSSGGMFIAWFVFATTLLGLAYYTYLDHRERRRAKDREEMERWAEPARMKRVHEIPRDHIIDYDALPDDHRDWSWR